MSGGERGPSVPDLTRPPLTLGVAPTPWRPSDRQLQAIADFLLTAAWRSRQRITQAVDDASPVPPDQGVPGG
jgi:hypothetical protein